MQLLEDCPTSGHFCMTNGYLQESGDEGAGRNLCISALIRVQPARHRSVRGAKEVT